MSVTGEDDWLHPPVVERARIAIRERPVADEELSAIQVRLRTDEDKLVAFPPGSQEGLMYDYDYYFPPSACQSDLFHTIGLEMVDVVMGGLSANCVAFGLANSGKTHTLFGSENENGLIQDTVRELFRRLETQCDAQGYQVSLRYWEMNRDRVGDVLAGETDEDGAEGSGLQHSVFRDGFDRLYVSHLNELPVANYEEFEALLNDGNARRIQRGFDRLARWHGFVQLSITTTNKNRGDKCVLREMTFVHMKGPERAGQRGARGEYLKTASNINVSVTLLCAAIIHSLEYRDKRMPHVHSREALHRLVRQSESFFMECRFSQIMSQLICGHEASFVIGCVDPLCYNETIDTLENLQLFPRLRCACWPIVTLSEKGRLLQRLRKLEGGMGGSEVLAAIYEDRTGRPLTEAEEELLQLRGQIEGWGVANTRAAAESREAELKQRGRDQQGRGVASANGRGANFATHGDRKRIYLNAAKSAHYEGQWADGLFGGFGEHVQANFKYKGEFREGKREGEGTLFVRASPDAPYTRVYQGEWLAGKRDGRGTQWAKNGEVYEGDFQEDQRCGMGKLFCTNGDVIEGQFLNNGVEGWATLRLANGDWFEGYWSNGMREGPGIWHYVKRKQLLRGEWSKNISVMGTLEDDEDKASNQVSGFIPRIGLVDYQALFATEREKLNEKRKRDFAAQGRQWIDHQSADSKTSNTVAANGVDIV